MKKIHGFLNVLKETQQQMKPPKSCIYDFGVKRQPQSHSDLDVFYW